MANTLLDANDSALLVVDIQEKFVPAMNESKRLVDHGIVLVKAARELGIPVVISEHYPKGLGHTVSELLAAKPEQSAVLEKTAFGCLGDSGIREYLASLGKKQIVVCGLETHICVNQTVQQLIASGQYQVHVVEDAVASRTPESREIGLAKMRQAGAVPASVESVLFEWMADAKHPAFKNLQALIK